MACILPLLLLLLVCSFFCPNLASANASSRCAFPDGFLFGAASSAYQFEGAASDGGRKPSIWDTFSHGTGNVADGSTGDVAVDQYHRFQDDVLLLKSLGMDTYRFSISWSRFFPDDKVNEEGLKYYNSLINALLEQGIEPFVTLYHWDLPQAIQDNMEGWLNPRIVEKFKLFAKACFQAFGDRVKYWVTFNEPQMFILRGYVEGDHAPGRCSSCAQGNSGTEPYIVAHNVLLSHAAVVQVYRRDFARQESKIGFIVNTAWYQAYSDSHEDVTAAANVMQFEVGWFLHPLVYGGYPEAMKTNVGDRLPVFSEEEIQLLVGSFDFIGVNYYTSHYAKYLQMINSRNYITDSAALRTNERNGVFIGPKAAEDWQYIVPTGIRDVLNYVHRNYKNPEIIVTENGVHELDTPSSKLEDYLDDQTRVLFFQEHLNNVLAAIRDGVKVRGYIAWSLLDNWEWSSGFKDRFGIFFVDYKQELKRYPKASAFWFQRFLSCQQLNDI